MEEDIRNRRKEIKQKKGKKMKEDGRRKGKLQR